MCSVPIMSMLSDWAAASDCSSTIFARGVKGTWPAAPFSPRPAMRTICTRTSSEPDAHLGEHPGGDAILHAQQAREQVIVPMYL